MEGVDIKAEIIRIRIKRTNDVNNLGNVISKEVIGEKEVPDNIIDTAILAFTGKTVEQIYRELVEENKRNAEKNKTANKIAKAENC